MKNEQINIAIAEACGWKSIGRAWVKRVIIQDAWESPSGEIRTLRNYCNDLNAMHEAEETLDLQKAGVFAEQLRVTVYRTTRLPHVDSGSFAHVHATASQRGEAFLKTIGKWEEKK
jgi:hypothetical protein